MDKTAYEVCKVCSGSGLQDGLYGPVDCSNCNGKIMIRVRNSKGQYALTDLKPSDPDSPQQSSESPSVTKTRKEE